MQQYPIYLEAEYKNVAKKKAEQYVNKNEIMLYRGWAMGT